MRWINPPHGTKRMKMIIDISKHFFGYYAYKSETIEHSGFRVGEIVTDWHGETACILTITKNGDVRTDTNGMGDISTLKKVKSKSKIAAYLKDLHSADMRLTQQVHESELACLAAL